VLYQLDETNQTRFRDGEGFELMVRMVKAKGFAKDCAIKVLDYATANNQANCKRFVDAGGLKFLFPAFMGKGAKKTAKLHGASEVAAVEEHCVAIVSAMFALLPARSIQMKRLLAKFLSGDLEKTDRAVELFLKYSTKVGGGVVAVVGLPRCGGGVGLVLTLPMVPWTRWMLSTL